MPGSGLRTLITSEYEPDLIAASYKAFLRGEVGTDHMILVIAPVIGAAMLLDHLDQSWYDQDDLISTAIEAILVRLEKMKEDKVVLRYPLTYFIDAARRRMKNHITAIQREVFRPDNGNNPLGSRMIGYEDIEREIFLYQISSFTHEYCRTRIRFQGAEKDACGYALIKIMSGGTPSEAFMKKRYGLIASKARFLGQYCEVLFRMSKREARAVC